MYKAFNFCTFQRICRQFSTTELRNYKVCVVGGSGGIGQPLSLLLKCNKLVTQLAVYDIKGVRGVLADLLHVDTNCEVQGFQCPKELKQAVHCSHVVLITGGMARKPGMKRDDLFKTNADVVAEVVTMCAGTCPSALIAIITNPVNSLVPMAAEIMKKYKVFDPKRLFGVTTLDVVRARAFVGDYLQIDTEKVKVDVIGGHSGTTILPIMSKCKPKVEPDDDQVKAIVKRLQNAGNEVIEAKEGAGSATLSMAYAANKFTTSLLMGLTNNGAASECSYVHSDVTDAPFFATELSLGKKGILKNMGLPKMNREEMEAMIKMLPQLQKEIDKGIEYGKKYKKVECDAKGKKKDGVEEKEDEEDEDWEGHKGAICKGKKLKAKPDCARPRKEGKKGKKKESKCD